MHRATPVNTSFRAYVAGGARCLIDEGDDKQLMQETKAQFMKGEERKEIETPQNYGFTSLVVKAEKSDDGQIDKCAEGFVQFMGGNRTFPVIEVRDDRRFRLWNFKEGESAVYDDQQQKLHMQRERIYGRSQHKVELRVIKDQKYMDGHGSDQSASRDQQEDKSRRWSTIVMNKDTITIERTNIVNDDDKDDPQKHTQDEPEKHIVMLSRVFLDAMHVHVFTPNISIQWDEDKRTLVLNTEKTIITMEDKHNDSDPYINIQTPKASITIDDKEQFIKSSTANTDVVLNEKDKKVQVGDKTAKIPAAMLGSIDSNGDKIVGNVAKKVLVI